MHDSTPPGPDWRDAEIPDNLDELYPKQEIPDDPVGYIIENAEKNVRLPFLISSLATPEGHTIAALADIYETPGKSAHYTLINPNNRTMQQHMVCGDRIWPLVIDGDFVVIVQRRENSIPDIFGTLRPGRRFLGVSRATGLSLWLNNSTFYEGEDDYHRLLDWLTTREPKTEKMSSES